MDDEQEDADRDEHVERGELRREVPGRHHADQAGDHAEEGREIDHSRASVSVSNGPATRRVR